MRMPVTHSPTDHRCRASGKLRHVTGLHRFLGKLYTPLAMIAILTVLSQAFFMLSPPVLSAAESVTDGAESVTGREASVTNRAESAAEQSSSNTDPSESDAALLGSANAGAERPQALFNRGNFMMEEQNYAEALEIFRQIESRGSVSGPLFYNMGISHLYLDSLGKASLYFHKSTAYRETAGRGKEGLEVVERLMRTRGTFIPQLPWYAFFDWFFFYMNHLAWIVWGLLLLNAGVLVLVAGWMYRPDRRITIAGTVVAAVGIILIITSVTISIWANGYRQGVVVANTVQIQPQPDLIVDEDMAPDLAYEAYTVTLDQRKSRLHEDWVHIRLRNGVSGWIPESSVRLL